MDGIERSSRLADHEPSTDGHGECFIAIHMYDGSVQAISGIADTVTIKPDTDDYISWSGGLEAECNGWDVTVHFNSNLVREAKSMDGRVVYGWNVFGECPIKGREVVITSGSMAGETFKVEDWARNVMAKGPDWVSDIGNPAVLNFWLLRPDLSKNAQENMVEFYRIALSALYGHVGWSGYIVMPEELGIEVDG